MDDVQDLEPKYINNKNFGRVKDILMSILEQQFEDSELLVSHARPIVASEEGRKDRRME